jgi:polysaccharide biosynthesis/export protein
MKRQSFRDRNCGSVRGCRVRRTMEINNLWRSGLKGIVLRQFVAFIVVCHVLCAQTPQAPPQTPPRDRTLGAQPTELTSQVDQLRPNYVLRPGDQVLLRAFEMEEMSERPFRIDGDGFIDLPVLGRVKAEGITVQRFEATLVELLKKYVRVPQVTVTVVQFSSDPVFFVGAFKSPGIYPLGGRRTLVEMMTSIGGLQPTASRRIKVTRRKENGDIPLPGSVPSLDGNGTSVEINMTTLQNNVNPAEDIVLQPFDVVSVERAEMIYVTGEVGKNGAFDLQERDSISVIQALTLAGGLAPTADSKGIRILRPIQNTSRRAEIPLNLTRIMKGEDTDKPLLPNDVLYVPKGRGIFSKALVATVVPLLLAGVSLGVLATR